jgi:hypothetical protein
LAALPSVPCTLLFKFEQIAIRNIEVMAILRKFLFLVMAANFSGRQGCQTILKENHPRILLSKFDDGALLKLYLGSSIHCLLSFTFSPLYSSRFTFSQTVSGKFEPKFAIMVVPF